MINLIYAVYTKHSQAAELLPPRTLELQAIAPPPSQYLPYDAVTEYTPHIEGTYEEGVTEETLDTSHVVSPETDTIQPIQITPPKNVVAIHNVDESSRGVYNLSNSAVKIIQDVASFAQRKGGTSSTEGPSPFVVQQECGQAVGESEKHVRLDSRGKVIWPYSCITIEHYVSAWERGTDKLPPVTLWREELNDKSKHVLTGDQKENARSNLWKHERIYKEFTEQCEKSYLVWREMASATVTQHD